YELALTLARELADRRHQADLHWHLAIAHAEADDRRQAIIHGQSAIGLFQELGHPGARTYVEHLDKYRLGAGSLGRKPELVTSSGGYVQTVSARDMTQGAQGAGLLKMALAAAKAMVKF